MNLSFFGYFYRMLEGDVNQQGGANQKGSEDQEGDEHQGDEERCEVEENQEEKESSHGDIKCSAHTTFLLGCS